MAAPTFIRMRVSPAKAAIDSDRAIAEKVTGAWLPCQVRSASHRPARSKYTFFTIEPPRPPSRLAADARPQPSARNVRFGSQADIALCQADVRFIPESGHWLRALECPLCAKSGHS